MAVAGVFAMLACSAQPASQATESSAPAHPVARGSAPDVGTELRALLDDGAHAASDGLVSDLDELRAVYERSHYRPLWLDANGRPSADASEALTLLREAGSEGLDAATYRSAELEASAATLASATAAEPGDLARFDLQLTDSTLRYLRHLHLGRVDPRQLRFDFTPPPDAHAFPAVLYAAVAEHQIAETAAELRPALPEYEALRTALAEYRALAGDPSLVPLLKPRGAVRPGDPYDGVAALHRLLAALGDLEPADAAPVSMTYEGALVDGIERFQRRHGLGVDGILGSNTFEALTVPLSWRVRQIELSLERLRWLPDFDEGRLVLLNIPMFRVWAWDAVPPNGRPSFASDVIVGRALRTETPVFVDEMSEVIFRPYWNVPSSITLNEILPKLASNPDYLVEQEMEVVDRGSGRMIGAHVGEDAREALRQQQLRIRQRPGPKNSLGLVKFVFPNDDNVYMHGTPATELFSRHRRDFSHGCVRVQDPVGFAEWVLQRRPEWTRDRILAAMQGDQPAPVRLEQPIQVVLFYTTAAIMPEDGMLRFAPDIYRHDDRLHRALHNASQ
jgi:murein L,D-transpeptidase YcbB/YkuD